MTANCVSSSGPQSRTHLISNKRTHKATTNSNLVLRTVPVGASCVTVGPGVLQRDLPSESSQFGLLRPTNAYCRYHYLRNVARQPIGAPRSLNSCSVTRRDARRLIGVTGGSRPTRMVGGEVFQMWLATLSLNPPKTPMDGVRAVEGGG